MQKQALEEAAQDANRVCRERLGAERAMDRAFEQGATNVREVLAYVRRCGGTSFAAVGVGFAVVFALAVVEVLAGI